MGNKDAGRRGGGGWVFLAAVVAVYGVTAFVKPDVTGRAMAFFVQVLDRVIPVLALVFVLIFLFDLFLTPKRIEKYIGKKSGIRGWLVVVAAGILSTGPIYAWYAVLSELRKKGMRTSLVAVFLYNRAIKFPLLPLMVHYFGVRYTVVLSLYLIGFSIISGLVMEKIEDKGAVPG